MSVKERLTEYLEHKGLSQAKFEKLAKLSNGLINNMRVSIGPKTQLKIKAAFPDLNMVWLLQGEGEMIKKYPVENEGTLIGTKIGEYINKTGTTFEELSDGRYIMKTPLVMQRSYASYLNGWGDPEYIDDLPTHPIIVEKPHLGTYRSFENSGDSMNDGTSRSIEDRDIISGRRIERSLWRNRLHINKFKEFVIVTYKDGIVTKNITAHDTEKHTITCHSYNPDKQLYPDFELNLDDVMEIYNIVQVTKQRR